MDCCIHVKCRQKKSSIVSRVSSRNKRNQWFGPKKNNKITTPFVENLPHAFFFSGASPISIRSPLCRLLRGVVGAFPTFVPKLTSGAKPHHHGGSSLPKERKNHELPSLIPKSGSIRKRPRGRFCFWGSLSPAGWRYSIYTVYRNT